MDYKVLYRKYRPEDFSNIIGQDYIVSILKNAIKRDKTSHAYIFSGPRGTGKTSTAKVFAKAINCLNPTENGPCNECESCKNFKNNADIIEIDAASNNGVDEIREIINNIKLAPSYSKYKVYIIDEVHMLSTSAFNALLLTLEEPPKHVIFILATTNIEAVPITILSRCQRFDFHKIKTESIINRLNKIASTEQIQISESALEEIAYISDGGMRDALSILDQLSSSASNITLNDVVSHFGTISKKHIDDLFSCLITNDVSKFLDLMDKIKETAVDYKILIKKLLERIEQEAIRIKKENIETISYGDLKNLAFELASISNYININTDPYILIEITTLKYFKVSTNSNIKEEPPKQVNETKTENKITPPKTPISKELINIRINNCFVSAKKEYLEKLKPKWIEFQKAITDKSLLSLLIDSNIVVCSQTYAIISSKIEGTVNLINENLDNISNAFNSKYQEHYKFVALSEEKWNIEKQKYINNIKNKIPYEMIEEEIKQEEKKEAPPQQEQKKSIEKIALDIFDKEKIEIK